MFENRRVYLLTGVAYMGAMLFGFDTGVMGSVLAMESFKNDFGLPLGSDGFSDEKNASVSSNVVSLLTAGSFFGAIAAAFINEKWGRLYTLMGFCGIFLVGAALQTGAHHEIGLIYAGRVIAGLGIGGCSAVMSVFVSEAAPPKVRGRIAGLFQEMLVIGSTFAYWLDYGCALHIPSSTKQWRVPVSIQLVLGGIMFTGLFFLKESPRWLCKQGRHDKAIASLAHIRCKTVDSPEIIHEMAEIRASIEEELNATEGVTWKECLTPGNRKRFLIAFIIMFWQQFSGTNSIGYYAPQIFQTVGLSKADSSMFATGIYGTVKVVATAIFLYVGIDRFGRKKSLIAGGFWMAAMMFIIGAVLATHPPDPEATGYVPTLSFVLPLAPVMYTGTWAKTTLHTHPKRGISVIDMFIVYLFVIGYSASWGPVPWVLVSEIFPTRLRAYGVGLAAATQWLFNFVITKITPSAINSIGWRTFLMFAIFCVCMAIFVWIFVPETKQLTLEEIDVVFGVVDAETRAKDVEKAIEVEKSKAGVDYDEGDENADEKAETTKA